MLTSTIAIETPEGAGIELQAAGPVSRAWAWLIDLVLRSLLYLVLFLVVGSAFAALIESLLPEGEEIGGYLAGVASITLFMLEWFLTAIPEALWGTTPGKKLAGLRVIHIDGTPISWRGAVLRNLLRAADFLPVLYFFGLLSCLSDRHFRRLGDLAAGTVVVRNDRRAAAAERGVAPSQPPLTLRAPERAAVLAFDERIATFSAERAAELVAPLRDGSDPDGEATVLRVRGWASWLRGERVA